MFGEPLVANRRIDGEKINWLFLKTPPGITNNMQEQHNKICLYTRIFVFALHDRRLVSSGYFGLRSIECYFFLPTLLLER